MIDEVFQMSLLSWFDLETVLLSYGLPHLEFPPERFPAHADSSL
jgi:TATA-box binding protein (TBP) (component of TFIID and TFIIIB)